MDHDEEVTRILSCNSHFEVLSVTKHSTNEEVKRSFRTLALRTHPDKNKHVHATEAFKRVTGAFQSLDTQEKRTMYHARGGRGFANHTEHHHHDDDDESDDVFKFFNMFMRSGGFGQGADFGRGERGVSIHDLMMLMMMRDLMFGGGGGGGFHYDEDDEDEYYEDYDEDDEYYDEEEEEEEEEHDAPKRDGEFQKSTREFVCWTCNVKTKTRQDMTSHLHGKKHIAEVDKEEFHCPTCDIRTHTKTAKANHLASKKHLRSLRAPTKQ